MNFGIPSAFAYLGTALDLFWPIVMAGAAFGLGWICGGCAQRG